MLNFRRKEKGISLIQMIIAFILLALVVVYGTQIGFAYINKSTVHSAVKTALTEAKSNDNATVSSIRSAVFTKISTNETGLTTDDIIVSKKSGGFIVEVKMAKEIEISENISLNIHFEFAEESE